MKQVKSQKKRTVYAKKKTDGFPDLLLPLLLVVGLMPFLLHFTEYSNGFAQYPWHSNYDMVQDFYCVFRSRFFVWVAAFMVIILAFRLVIYKEKTKPVRVFFPLFAYSAFVFLSLLTSKDVHMSLTGAPHSGETVFVLIGYVVLCFFTYQILETERDFKALHITYVGVLICMLLLGGVQICGRDILDYEWVQRLVMSAADEQRYLGKVADLFSSHYVYLTLFNPNYAGQFLAMGISYVVTRGVTEPEQKKKRLYFALGVLLLPVLWFTYARGALVSLAAGLVTGLIMGGFFAKGNRTRLLIGAGALVCITLGVLLLDGLTGFHFIGRIADTREELLLSEITTGSEGVTIVYDGQQLVLDDLEEGESKTLTLAEREWTFTKKDSVYYYANEAGKLDEIAEIPAVSFGGLEYLASGRLYIWSRTLPLLKDYILTGSGAETFLLAYPQNDYVGKANYSHSTTMIIEKAHNGFLMTWVQTGLLSLLCLLAFGAGVLKRAGEIRRMGNDAAGQMAKGAMAAVVAYLAGFFFNDSTLFTTPMLCVFVGLMLSAAALKKEGRE